jgi:hypothetical protein
VRVIKSDETFSIFCMKCQRIIESMRFLGRGLDLGYGKADPMLSDWVDDDNLSIQVEQGVEPFVTPLVFHHIRLSVADNFVKRGPAAKA